LLAPVHPKAPDPIGDGTHPAQFRSALDPLAALAFVAGHPARVALGTSVLVLPLYNPILLARQLTTRDVLSKGRLRVGLGVRWNMDALEASGVPWAERGPRTDEALHVLKAIWTTDPVEFHGRYSQIPPAYIGLKPIQKPHPPIYLAAFTPAAMPRLAREANGWNLAGVPLTAVLEKLHAMQQMARDAGRDPQALELVVRANVKFSATPLGADRMDFHGTLDQIGADVAKARQVGATELFFDLWTAHPQVHSVDDWLARMAQLWQIARPS
jgi:probable F420-dependent oxidoreductase